MLFRALLAAAVAATPLVGQTDLERLLEELTASGEIVGAQMLIGNGGETEVERNFGAVAPDSHRDAGPETQFCIGSVSKPLASSVVLSLVNDGSLTLDKPVSRWLEGFDQPPTLRQLLSHHGGVYSQRDGMTDAQKRWIRDFRLTLKEAVDGILGEEQSSEPGRRYAYSGAGYCVVGRLAEIASGRSMEELLQQRLAGPLGMSRTTYFPAPSDVNVATGLSEETPHLLGENLRLPLIGGSIYSTARDLARFARMMAGRGKLGSSRVMPGKLWREMISHPSFTEQQYALGWSIEPGTMRIRHNGALAASRAALRIDLESGRYVIVLYSLGKNGKAQARVTQAATDAL